MHTPDVLRSRYERELHRIISGLEAGGDWPAPGTEDSALLQRAMRPDPGDRKEWAVARIAICRPDRLARSRKARIARIDAQIAVIEAGGQWPQRGSADSLAIAAYITPGNVRFRQDVFDRIGGRARPDSDRRASAAQMEEAAERIVASIERTGIWPRNHTPDGRHLAAWLRPADSRFRIAVWRRIEAKYPDCLNYSAFDRELGRIAAAVADIEAGAPWPKRQSVAGALIARALDRHGPFFREPLRDRLEAAAPDAVRAAESKKGRPSRTTPSCD